jgi:hypothetical protein
MYGSYEMSTFGLIMLSSQQNGCNWVFQQIYSSIRVNLLLVGLVAACSQAAGGRMGFAYSSIRPSVGLEDILKRRRGMVKSHS